MSKPRQRSTVNWLKSFAELKRKKKTRTNKRKPTGDFGRFVVAMDKNSNHKRCETGLKKRGKKKKEKEVQYV